MDLPPIQSHTTTAYLLVNFGGPRSLNEVESFLIELLCDQEVIRTPFPSWLHRWFFSRVARKRAVKVADDYELIGGKSPIFEDTETIARAVGERLSAPVFTFHRYLPETHADFLRTIEQLAPYDCIRIIPLFPQFSYATTGSIALWFKRYVPTPLLTKMTWLKSYYSHPRYIANMSSVLGSFLRAQGIEEEEVCLLFSAHGLPQQFIDKGDPYEKQCRDSFTLISKEFPKAVSVLSYQSQFGKDPWIQPYTSEVSAQIGNYAQGRTKIVLIPLSFTSDHVETLFEVEYTYVKAIREQGFAAYRCPALNLREDWLDTLADLFRQEPMLPIDCLLRK